MAAQPRTHYRVHAGPGGNGVPRLTYAARPEALGDRDVAIITVGDGGTAATLTLAAVPAICRMIWLLQRGQAFIFTGGKWAVR